jgi:hypothetical protein
MRPAQSNDGRDNLVRGGRSGSWTGQDQRTAYPGPLADGERPRAGGGPGPLAPGASTAYWRDRLANCRRRNGWIQAGMETSKQDV